MRSSITRRTGSTQRCTTQTSTGLEKLTLKKVKNVLVTLAETSATKEALHLIR